MKNPFKNNTTAHKEFGRFREQVELELSCLSREMVVRFAWRCAVRALPFLGEKGNFDFWKNNEQQMHLQAVFYAIDITTAFFSVAGSDAVSAAFSNGGSAINVPDFAAKAASRAANTSPFVADTSYIAADASYSIAAIAASFAARTASLASTKALVAEAADTATAAFIVTRDFIGFDHAVFNQLIKQELQYGYVSSWDWVELYKPIIERFNTALELVGCSYWAEWYKRIFEKGFELDEEDEKEIAWRLNVPAEIREQGAATVGQYMEQLKLGSKRLNEARILILGDKGAGKTCLARRLKDPNAEMTTDDQSTPGVETSVWKLEEGNVNVHIWDFAGHTVTHAVHQFFLSERCLYILVFDGRTEGNGRWEYWLDHMKNYGRDSKAIILVNKRDAHAVEVPINKLREQYPILDVCTFSIGVDKEDLLRFRKMVADYITTNPSWSNLLIPESSYKVKKELENLFINENNNGQELIERKVFDAIAEKCQVKEEDVEGLLSDLHALGISLWYKDMAEYNTLVLNPEWISNGVYRITNWANNQRKHCLKIGEFVQVFEKDATRYPKSQHRFLFDLMKKYQLAYEAKEKDVLIIPRLLHEDQPDIMPAFNVGESLMARYKADQPLMPDTISRFIVSHNEEIKEEGKDSSLVWRSGVILEEKKHKGTIALVRETDDRTIAVSVKGPNKTEYLSDLRETLNNIFEGYKSKKPELQYRVQLSIEIPEELEIWLADRKILAHYQRNIPYLEEYTGRQIPMNPTVNIYNIQGNALIGGQNNEYWDNPIFNFKDCNIDIQSNLNDLSDLLIQSGKTEEAKELMNLAQALEQVENSPKEEVKKKGIGNKLKRFLQELGDEESKLYKTIEGIKCGIEISKSIIEAGGKIVGWLSQ